MSFRLPSLSHPAFRLARLLSQELLSGQPNSSCIDKWRSLFGPSVSLLIFLYFYDERALAEASQPEFGGFKRDGQDIITMHIDLLGRLLDSRVR